MALAGDPVDNIPGVAGIGRKTAVALLARFGDLDEIYRCLDEVTQMRLRGARSVAARLAEQRETAFLCRRLAQLARDAPATAELAELRLEGARAEHLDPLLERLGITGLRKRVPRWAE